MKITISRLLLGLLSLSLLASIAQAQLVMTIDTTAETYTISGSDSGTPNSDFEGNSIAWMLHSGGGGFERFNLGAGIGLTTSTKGFFTNYSGMQFNLAFFLGSASEQTLTGTNTAISYASASSGFKSGMSSLASSVSSIAVQKGTGFQPLSIAAASAVPEPSTYAAIFGLFTLMGTVMVRRRKRTAA